MLSFFRAATAEVKPALKSQATCRHVCVCDWLICVAWCLSYLWVSGVAWVVEGPSHAQTDGPTDLVVDVVRAAFQGGVVVHVGPAEDAPPRRVRQRDCWWWIIVWCCVGGRHIEFVLEPDKHQRRGAQEPSINAYTTHRGSSRTFRPCRRRSGGGTSRATACRSR